MLFMLSQFTSTQHIMKLFSFLIFNMDSRNRYVIHKPQMFNTHSTHFGILIKGS